MIDVGDDSRVVRQGNEWRGWARRRSFGGGFTSLELDVRAYPLLARCCFRC